ncbi:MAG: carbohydrate ABC transporter permease [Treponema sp.]|jgi:multiple sugar transport system permease protein/putative aldouronate transport system permease protein|nr:carbohydrate ABC transporter permease [Treponema sp.]
MDTGKRKTRMRISGSDRVYLAVVYTFIGLFSIAVIYPLVYVVSASFSSPSALIQGRVFFFPVEPGLQGYAAVFRNDSIWRGYVNSILYTVSGTVLSVFLTMLGGFVLSRREFPLRVPVMLFFMITMFFSGGLVPSYLLITNLRILNTIWALILPGAFSVWFAVIVRTFIHSTIPEELFEATSLDGGNYFDYLFRVVWPLSVPVIAVMALSFATGHWNSYFNAMIYLNDVKQYPLQLILRSILIENTYDFTATSMSMIDIRSSLERQYLAELLKYSLIIVSSVPLLVVYPFLQKYFIKGIMVGSLKG